MPAEIKLKCPRGHIQVVPADRAGQRVPCTACDHVFRIPEAGKILVATPSKPAAKPSAGEPHARPAAARDASNPMDPPGKDACQVCPACAETIKAAAKVCRFCGHRVDDPVEPAASRSSGDTAADFAVKCVIFAAFAFLMAGVCSWINGGPTLAFVFLPISGLVEILAIVFGIAAVLRGSRKGPRVLVAAIGWPILAVALELLREWSVWSDYSRQLNDAMR